MSDNDSPNDEPVLRLDRVGLTYGPESDVLADVSLSLRPGSMTFLTGPSGAGKSTLLRLAYLALRPTSGRV
jgi:cell division transport system ATP-binding protein